MNRSKNHRLANRHINPSVVVWLQVALKLPKAPPCHQEVLIMEVRYSSNAVSLLSSCGMLCLPALCPPALCPPALCPPASVYLPFACPPFVHLPFAYLSFA